MIHFKATVFMPSSTQELLQKCNLESGGKVQQVIDKRVMDYCVPYCPFETGHLAQSCYAATTIGSGEVIYPGPYARYLYYGEVMGPNIPIFEDNTGEPTGWFSPPGKPKHLTGRELKYATDKNPQAGSHWFERMKADHLDDIIQEAQNAANG